MDLGARRQPSLLLQLVASLAAVLIPLGHGRACLGQPSAPSLLLPPGFCKQRNSHYQLALGLTCSEITQIDGKRGHHSPMAGVAVRRSFPSRITAKISHTIASKLIPHQNIIYSACQQLLTPLLAQDLRHKSPKEAPCAHLPSLC
ncbi:uncharacterized protein LOC133625763 isoform X6 [Colius striatus]|uniref:uncharacterized protein LOC133625763 isoform X6 n=1 Tax=Colius striatus TaxID=57412 RepID=UPI002B1E51D4|nr:uncharacterized protein LOC133625763 isoform X6 [Colius striatus]